MIKNGWAARGWAGYSGMRQSVLRSPASASRAVTPASSHTAAARIAIHSRPANAWTTITAIGVSTATTSDTQRTTPRRDRKRYAAARVTAAPTTPTATIAKLASPAKATTMTTARHASTKLSRASQRCERVASGPGDLCILP